MYAMMSYVSSCQ